MNNESLPPQSFPRVDEVQEIPTNGSWETKSHATLDVLFNLSSQDLEQHFFQHSAENVSPDSISIRGLRAYRITNLRRGAVGGMEWHKLRTELVFALQGGVIWTCRDIYGNTKDVQLDATRGIIIPPYILHTYTTAVDSTTLLVVANTTFDPSDSQTHDTYPAESFPSKLND